MFGVAAQVPSVGPDYYAYSCVRFHVAGVMHVWVMDFGELVRFIKAHVGDSACANIEAIKHTCLTQCTDDVLQQLKDSGRFFGAALSAGSLMYVPAHYFVWEVSTAHCHGIRCVGVLEPKPKQLHHASLQAWLDAHGSSPVEEEAKQLDALMKLVQPTGFAE